MILRTGEIAALVTALCWTITAISFENASKKIGSLSVNFVRLVMALAMLAVYLLITTGIPWPLNAGLKGWLWLSLSGVIGLFLGDLFLFRAFVMVGARISMLIFATVPILTAFISYFFLGEILALNEMAGMLITVTGIIMVVTHPGHSNGQSEDRSRFYGYFFCLSGCGRPGSRTYNDKIRHGRLSGVQCQYDPHSGSLPLFHRTYVCKETVAQSAYGYEK